MDPRRIVRNGYNAIAQRYLSARTTDSEDVHLLDDLMARLPDGARVLDAGCGAGVPIARALARRFRVTGVDVAEEQLRLARTLVPEAEFLCQDLTRLDLPEATFDAVVSYYAIIHIPREEHRPLLERFRRLLVPGGLALLCMGADELPADLDDYEGTPMYWSHYDAETNLALLAECGYRVLWSRVVPDATSPGAGHLFVLAQAPEEATPDEADR